MKIAIGSDHLGLELKNVVKDYLREQEYVEVEVIDVGVVDTDPVDYPDIAERSRKSNDAQIITLGALVIGKELAKKIIGAWLVSDFDGGGSTRKVEKMKKRDERYRKS